VTWCILCGPRHIPTATGKHATIEILWETVFSVDPCTGYMWRIGRWWRLCTVPCMAHAQSLYTTKGRADGEHRSRSPLPPRRMASKKFGGANGTAQTRPPRLQKKKKSVPTTVSAAIDAPPRRSPPGISSPRSEHVTCHGFRQHRVLTK
jgi:hypothetical protein